MTKSETAVLKALDASPDKTLFRNELRAAAGLTHRGFGIVTNRLESRNTIARADSDPRKLTLTFGGLRALNAA